MYVGGTVISSVEFHGNMSLVIFMSKCPLACRYCHNAELLDDNTQLSFEEIKKEINDAADFIDAVVISGGEPLVQSDAVIEILKYVHKLGLKTKLDIKAPFEKYRKVTGSNVGSQVHKSMNLINKYGVHLEARTTYVPTLHTKKDIYNLVMDIEAEVYTIQQFRNRNVLDPALEEVEVPNPHDLRKLAEYVKPYFDGVVKVKSAEFGEEII